MHNQATRAVFDYWINLKGNDLAPLRSAIEPVALRHLLPDLFILADDHMGTLVFRLAGTRICELFGREFRGLGFAEIWAPSERRQPVSIAENVIRHEQPAFLDVQASNARSRHSHEMLLLPLRSAIDQRSDRLIGCLLPQDGRVPAIEFPLTELALESWTFLTGSDSHFGVPVVPDRRDMSDGLRRLLPKNLRP